MDVFQKAKEFADGIENSEEVINYRMLEIELENHPVSKERWFQLYSKEKELQTKLSLGEQPSNREEEELEKIRHTAHADPMVSKFLKAQFEYLNLIEGINFILREALDIEEKKSACSECRGCGAKH